MTPNEFNALTGDLLIDPWGDKSYPKPVLSRLWRMVKDIGPGEFRQAMDAVMMTSTRPPTLGQIRGALMPAINRAAEERKRTLVAQLGAHTCQLCAGTGWVFVIPYDHPMTEGAFVCTKCESAKVRGINNGRGAEYWSDELEPGYFVRRHTRESTRAWLAMQEELSEDVQKLRRAKTGRRLSPQQGVAGWSALIMQGLREGKSFGELLQEPRSIQSEDADA